MRGVLMAIFLMMAGAAQAQMVGMPLVSTSVGGVVSATNIYARTISASSFVGNGAGLTGVTASGDNLGNHTATTMLNLNGNAITGSGNFTFAGANPMLSSGGSYITVPYGAYFSGGTSYFQTNTNFRGGIGNDSDTKLTIGGGTSGITAFSGNIDIGWERVNALSAGGAASVAVNCSSGKKVMGGGCSANTTCVYNSDTPTYGDLYGYPSSDMQWTCVCSPGTYIGGGTLAAKITAYAICARIQ